MVAADGVIACVYALVLPMMTRDGPTPGPALWWQGMVVAGIALPCAARRVWPVPVFWTVLAVTVFGWSTGHLREPFAAAAFALYPVALADAPRRGPSTRVIASVSLGLLAVGLVAGTPVAWQGDLVRLLPLGPVMPGASWAIGRALRDRRAAAARVTEELAGRAVAEERLRIARELHDSVAHSMGVVAAKAGVTRLLLPAGTDASVRAALHTIETTSREALTEMRRMLGVLRTEVGPDELAPAPGIAQLPELVRQAATVGVRAELDVRAAGDLPDTVQLTVYRIVQEALTNVVKHAGPTRCRVVVAATGQEVRIEVADDGETDLADPAAGAGGHGLVGMRERVAMYGGEFSAGRRDIRGFYVSASLPYRAGERR